jgi:hypothetical protein
VVRALQAAAHDAPQPEVSSSVRAAGVVRDDLSAVIAPQHDAPAKSLHRHRPAADTPSFKDRIPGVLDNTKPFRAIELGGRSAARIHGSPPRSLRFKVEFQR